jgi:uncharacterized membrane protein YbjE (DUF340 family)
MSNGETPNEKEQQFSPNQHFGKYLITFVGFFVMSVVVAVIVGWMQEKTGYQPQNLSSFLLFAFLFSAIGTLILNIGIKIFMPRSGGAPAFFVLI